MDVLPNPHPPIVAITMCEPTDPTIAYAHIDPNGVAKRAVDLLIRRHCRSFAFCSPHTPHLIGESTALLMAYRRELMSRTGMMPHLFRPISTLNMNLIATDYGRTLREEISALRLDLLAEDLRTSNEPIKALVARSGFGDMSRAIRAFKQRFGKTMSEYRVSPTVN